MFGKRLCYNRADDKFNIDPPPPRTCYVSTDGQTYAVLEGFGRKGDKRGNSSANDLYFTLGFHISYFIDTGNSYQRQQQINKRKKIKKQQIEEKIKFKQHKEELKQQIEERKKRKKEEKERKKKQ